jgi:hypothetical protein
MPHVLIVNPIEETGARTMAKQRSAAQKRATAKMIAANRRARRGRNPSKAVAARPSGRKSKRRPPRTRETSSALAVYRRRRNPIGGRRGFALDGFLKATLLPAAAGGAGALALDVLLGVLPLPPALKSGLMRPVVRIGGSLGIGALAGLLGGAKLGEQVAAGALTVVAYDMMRAAMPKILPSVPLSANDLELAYYQAGQEVGAADTEALEALEDEDGVGYYEEPGVGEYVDEYVR